MYQALIWLLRGLPRVVQWLRIYLVRWFDPQVRELRSQMLIIQAWTLKPLSPRAPARESENHKRRSCMTHWRSRVLQLRPNAAKLMDYQTEQTTTDLMGLRLSWKRQTKNENLQESLTEAVSMVFRGPWWSRERQHLVQPVRLLERFSKGVSQG